MGFEADISEKRKQHTDFLQLSYKDLVKKLVMSIRKMRCGGLVL